MLVHFGLDLIVLMATEVKQWLIEDPFDKTMSLLGGPGCT